MKAGFIPPSASMDPKATVAGLGNSIAERWPEINDPPRVEIHRIGRWTYAVIIKHGLIQYGPNGGHWLVLGRKRAERKARRVLRRYEQREAWQANPTVIGGSL